MLKGSTIRLRGERREKRRGEGRERKEEREQGRGRRKERSEDIRETDEMKRCERESRGGRENTHRIFQDGFSA